MGIKNLKVAICGDLLFGRTVHSLLKTLSRFPNIDFVLISPPELKIPYHLKNDVIEKYNVIGHSMGGEVAANIAYRYKNNVYKMILVDSAGYNGADIPNLPKIFIKNIVQSYLWQKIFYNNSIYKHNNDSKEIFNKLYSMNRQIPPSTLKKLNKTDDSGKLKDKMKKIDIPTLIIWGKEDKIIDVKYAYKFNKDIKGSKLIIIDNCGHIPNIEWADTFVKEVNNFLGNN